VLLSQEDNNDFHVAGYGFLAMIGLNFTFYKYFFLQTEVKIGYINMPDILTTVSGNEKANQHFKFLQIIVVFRFKIPVLEFLIVLKLLQTIFYHPFN